MVLEDILGVPYLLMFVPLSVAGRDAVSPNPW
jgi:hypothetical protein